MTIREKIIEGLLTAGTERLEKLIELGAPTFIITGQQQYVENLKRGEVKIAGEQNLLDIEFSSVEQKRVEAESLTIHLMMISISFL